MLPWHIGVLLGRANHSADDWQHDVWRANHVNALTPSAFTTIPMPEIGPIPGARGIGRRGTVDNSVTVHISRPDSSATAVAARREAGLSLTYAPRR